MRSTSRGSKKYPEKYDDPLGQDDDDDTVAAPLGQLPIRTGLSEEEDAARFLQTEFHPDAKVCPSCRVWFIGRASCECCGRPLYDRAAFHGWMEARRIRREASSPPLPPSRDPHVAGAMWNDKGTLRISRG